MKKTLTILLALVFVLGTILTGCGTSKPAESKPAESKAADKPKEEAKVITMKLGNVYSPTHMFTKASEAIAAKVKEKTGGKVEIKVFPASQLGSEKDLADQVNANTLDMAILGPGEMGKRYKPVLIFDGPFIFRDLDHALKVAKGDIGKELWDGLAKATNFRVISTMYYGTRYVTSGKKEVKTPDDMKGFKLRVPDQPMSVACAKGMNASPTPMALSEVYMALQQGVVDGFENSAETIMANKFYEVQNYMMLTGHVVQMTPLVISQKKLDSLPEEYRKILLQVAEEEGNKVIEEMRQKEVQLVKDFGAMPGKKVIGVDKEAFKKASAWVIKENEKDWGAGLYEKIQAIK